MTTAKRFLCRCEDISVDECVEAVAGGYECFEDLKRFLGVGTGPCQGKSCVQAAMHLIADHRGIAVDQVDVMTFRPPVRPIAFATLAAPDATDIADPLGLKPTSEGRAGSKGTPLPHTTAEHPHAEGP